MRFKHMVPVATLLLSFNAAVYAHDEADWIQRNPNYVDETGKPCCGPGDCMRFGKEYFRQDGDAVYFLPTMQKFKLNERGLYKSQTSDWWACVPGGNMATNGTHDLPVYPSAICIFIPPFTH